MRVRFALNLDLSFDGSALGVVQPNFIWPSFVIASFTQEGPITVPTPFKVFRFDPARGLVRVPSSQIHRGLTVSVPLLRVWVRCLRASNGLLPGRSNLVGTVQWDARFDQVLLVKQSFPTALQVAILEPRSGQFPV